MYIFWLLLQTLFTLPLLPRDIGSGLDGWSLNRQINSWTSQGWTIHEIFDKVAEKNPTKPAIHVNQLIWNFKQLRDFSLTVANHFKNLGYTKGDVVAMLVEDHPRYVGTWLGLSRIGVVSALLHTGISGDALVYAMTKATKTSCKAIIVSAEFIETLENLHSSGKLPRDIKVILEGPRPPKNSLPALEHLSLKQDDPNLLQPIDEKIVKSLDMNSKMFYVFTSGLEDNPKAAALTFKKFAFFATSVHKMMGIHSNDVIYNPIPMFHASGGLMGTGQMLLFGNTLIIKKKFKESEYFPDCKQYKATVAQYTGSMCSFLYLMKPSSADRDHHVRLMIGSGMHRKLWKDFKKRFGVKRIGEFYGSIEGNTHMFNKNNKFGSVGFKPWFSSHPDLVEYNQETGQPLRDKNGFCIRARWSGLHLDKIEEDGDDTPAGGGDNSKIIENAFKKGDKYLNTDHVLERSILNYYYIVERVSYSFRWKGDEVATKVHDIIAGTLSLKKEQVAVYSVKIPNINDMAGMVAFDMEDEKLDKTKLWELFEKKLSRFFIPAFLCVSPNLLKTGGSTINKAELTEQGFNPATLVGQGKPDKLYYYKVDEEHPYYAPLTQDVYELISKGDLTF